MCVCVCVEVSVQLVHVCVEVLTHFSSHVLLSCVATFFRLGGGDGGARWAVAVSSAQQVLCATTAAARVAASAGGSSRKRKASTQSASRAAVPTCVGCCVVVSRSLVVEPELSPVQRQKPPPIVLTDVWSDDSEGDEREQHIGTGRMQRSSADRRRRQELATRRKQEQLRFKEWYGRPLRLGFVHCSQSPPCVLGSNDRGVCGFGVGTVKHMR